MFLPESGHSQRPWPGARWIAPVDPWQPTSLRRRRSGSANGRVRALAARKLLFRQRQSGGRATKLRRAFRSLGIAASLARARHEQRWGNSREMGCAAAVSATNPRREQLGQGLNRNAPTWRARPWSGPAAATRFLPVLTQRTESRRPIGRRAPSMTSRPLSCARWFLRVPRA